MPNFESLYQLCEIARRQGYLEWAKELEDEIHRMEVIFL